MSSRFTVLFILCLLVFLLLTYIPSISFLYNFALCLSLHVSLAGNISLVHCLTYYLKYLFDFFFLMYIPYPSCLYYLASSLPTTSRYLLGSLVYIFTYLFVFLLTHIRLLPLLLCFTSPKLEISSWFTYSLVYYISIYWLALLGFACTSKIFLCALSQLVYFLPLFLYFLSSFLLALFTDWLFSYLPVLPFFFFTFLTYYLFIYRFIYLFNNLGLYC